MNNKVVSVVIPVYNVQKYLKRCMDSVMNQTYKNLEIILIDDGSTDLSSEMCDHFKEIDSRVKVIHKENAGLGMARNTGIENSTGYYISFVDSDDYIEKNTIEEAVLRAEKDNSDMVLYGYNKVDSKGNIISFIPNPKKELYKNTEVIEELLKDYIFDDPVTKIKRNFTNSSCTCLYKTTLFKNNNIRYPSERVIISEDTYMCLDMFRYLEVVSIIKESYYYYCENFGSLSRSYKKDRFEKLKFFYNESIKLIRKNNYPKEVKDRFKYLFLDYIFADFKTIIRNTELSKDEKRKEFKVIINDEIFRKCIEQIDLRHEKKSKKIFLILCKKRMTRLTMFLAKIKYHN